MSCIDHCLDKYENSEGKTICLKCEENYYRFQNYDRTLTSFAASYSCINETLCKELTYYIFESTCYKYCPIGTRTKANSSDPGN